MSGVNEVGASVVKAVGERQEVRAAHRSEIAEPGAGQRPGNVSEASKAQAPTESNSPANTAAVSEAVKAINAQVQRVAQNLKFTVDQDSGRTVVKVVEGESGKIIRQIPSEEALAISEALEKMQGLIIQQKA